MKLIIQTSWSMVVFMICRSFSFNHSPNPSGYLSILYCAVKCIFVPTSATRCMFYSSVFFHKAKSFWIPCWFISQGIVLHLTSKRLAAPSPNEHNNSLINSGRVLSISRHDVFYISMNLKNLLKDSSTFSKEADYFAFIFEY